MDLSIIVVNYNTKDLTSQAVKSVLDTVRGIQYEIIISDNNSTDGSIELFKKMFPLVKLIQNKSNLGFSKGNNIAIKQSKGKYILLLNSDTVVVEDCIKKCIEYMEKEEDIGALGCKVILNNGQLDHACKRGFPTPEASIFYLLKLHKFSKNKKFNQYTLNNLDENKINEVDCLTGAFMMLRREVIDKVGLLDEQFFMYGEDIDWCYRIKEAGWKIVYYPEGKIIHYKGGSSKRRHPKIIYEFHRAMLLFYRKHYLKKYSIVTTAFVYLGIYLKMILSLFINMLK